MSEEWDYAPHRHCIVDKSDYAMYLEHKEQKRAHDDLRAEAYADWVHLNARIDQVEKRVERLAALVGELGLKDMDDLK